MSNAKQREAALRTALGKVSPAQFQDIREAYFKAAEGIATLAEALELADLADTDSMALLEEHFAILDAVAVLNNSPLGRIV